MYNIFSKKRKPLIYLLVENAYKMDYLQRIIHEEMKKKLNEGFFDYFNSRNDRASEEEIRQRINKALQNFRQSLINVCGNLLRYGQTIQDYQSVKTAGELEKYANKYISSIGGYIYNIGKQEGDVLIPDSDYEDEAGTAVNIPRPPQDEVSSETEQEPQSDIHQNTEQEPQQQQGNGVQYNRGWSAPELHIEPEDDDQEELPEEEDDFEIEYVTKPTIETNRYGKRVVFFDDGSKDYSLNSVYRIFVPNDDLNVGSFELIDNDFVRNLVTTNLNDYLFSCCEGSWVKGARRIVTTKKGTVVSDKNGERWRVKDKAEIECQR